MTSQIKVAIIGAGIVGLATGLEFTRRFPGISVAVLDKESAVASHQTSHNSGVIHSGIYYKPGSLKARLCVEGAAGLVSFCQQNAIPYELCGKVIVATRESEFPQLEELYRRGQGNRLEGLKMLSKGQIVDLEPHAAGLRGIHVPGTGIVDYGLVAKKYAELIAASGGQILLSREVIGLKRAVGGTIVETSEDNIEAKLVINCAGLQSDRVSRMSSSALDLRIVPFRGEYYELSSAKQHYVKGLIYPVPDPAFPFLGVHFTRRIGGGVEAGPNAVLAFKREGYSKRSFALDDVRDLAAFPGFWMMAANHWKMSLGEYHRSWSKRAFAAALQRLVPDLSADDLHAGGSGVRAQALGRDGKLIDDFHFVNAEGIIHVCNVPSPAATASLAIGQYIVDAAIDRLEGLRA